MVTNRIDLDAAAAAAVISGLVPHSTSVDPGFPLKDVAARVEMITNGDLREDLARATWSPGTYNPDPENPLLAAVSADVKATRDMKEAVKKTAEFLNDGFVNPAAVSRQEAMVAQRRRDAEEIATSGACQVAPVVGVPVASLTSTSQIALDYGYSKAPVVVATNPEFKPRDGDPVVKHTVALHPSMGFDTGGRGESGAGSSLADLLNAAESAAGGQPGWGPSRGKIVGSPQGVSSRLSNEQVSQVVKSWVESGGVPDEWRDRVSSVAKPRRVTLPGE